MIRVEPADKPDTFDEMVRQPGLEALTRRVGEYVPGSGRRPAEIYACREDVPSKHFKPTWRAAIDALMERYDSLCAYTALYIEHGTGDATVDHFIPVSSNWRTAYEWSNYRLACGQVNTNKDVNKPLDPFKIEDHWFELDLVGYQVVPGNRTVDPLRSIIDETINIILNLNNRRFRNQRSTYALEYQAHHITLDYLERRAPFVARELRRQNKLHPADTVPPT